MWLYYVVFTRKKVPRLSKAKKGLPIFEWPDVLFQEKVNVIAQRENTLPLPGHQHSLVMKCFIWGLIVCVAAASIVEPDFFINNGMNNFYPRPYRFSCFGFG